jgi:hypothetical protein
MNIWKLAQQNRDVMVFSTLFTAQNVKDFLSSEQGLNDAIQWCKETGITKVYIETFRDGYLAETETIINAKKRFEGEGFLAAGCVATTEMKKNSTGWKIIPCFTSKEVQKQLQDIVEYTASLFDLIIIDDFLFTDCECDECLSARGERSWSEYRLDLMMKLSRERILLPAREINPGVRIIIKYPQWYDHFHIMGYDVDRQTKEYDFIWAGTESREPGDERWGNKVQYESYYIMRWLGDIGGQKTGGGWYDSIDTGPVTYVEQARQTVLGGAGESLLFCYELLLEENGRNDIEALREEIPELFKLARLIKGKHIHGISAPKVPNSDPGKESYIFDFIGMLGFPLIPASKITHNVSACFLSYHALKDRDINNKIQKLIDNNIPIVMTDGIADKLEGIDVQKPDIYILECKGNPYSLLDIPRETLKEIRDIVLRPFNISFDVKSRVALYVMGDNLIALENFNNEHVDFNLSLPDIHHITQQLVLPKKNNIALTVKKDSIKGVLPARTLAVLYT